MNRDLTEIKAEKETSSSDHQEKRVKFTARIKKRIQDFFGFGGSQPAQEEVKAENFEQKIKSNKINTSPKNQDSNI